MRHKAFNWMYKIGFGAVLSIALATIAFTPQVAFAVIVTNNATGDVAGDGSDLANASFDLDVTTLGLVKTAFLMDGTQLADGAAVAKGTLVQFMIYVDNNTAADVDSVNVLDDLAGNFTFIPGSIQVDSTIVSGSSDADKRTAVLASLPAMSDNNDGDMAGYSGTTVSAGDGASNDVVTVPRMRVWAMMFTARVN